MISASAALASLPGVGRQGDKAHQLVIERGDALQVGLGHSTGDNSRWAMRRDASAIVRKCSSGPAMAAPTRSGGTWSDQDVRRLVRVGARTAHAPQHLLQVAVSLDQLVEMLGLKFKPGSASKNGNFLPGRGLRCHGGLLFDDGSRTPGQFRCQSYFNVILGCREAARPEPKDAGLGSARTAFRIFAGEVTGVHGFRARACGAPRNDDQRTNRGCSPRSAKFSIPTPFLQCAVLPAGKQIDEAQYPSPLFRDGAQRRARNPSTRTSRE